jgi:hypothetical protein
VTSPPPGLTPDSGVPYYSQWESAELVLRFVGGELDSAADPRWAASGASSAADYGFWAPRVCGLACLRMILAFRGLPVPPVMRLVERALAWHAYRPDGDRVVGLIYRPFADWVAAEFGFTAQVAADLSLDAVAGWASPATPVIASVHPFIRWPELMPPGTGGHLVLVTGASGSAVRLHNPSGVPGASQRDAMIGRDQFERFFAGRGLLVGS